MNHEEFEDQYLNRPTDSDSWHDEEFEVASLQQEPEESFFRRLKRRLLFFFKPHKSNQFGGSEAGFTPGDDKIWAVDEAAISQAQRLENIATGEISGQRHQGRPQPSKSGYLVGDLDEFQIAGGTLKHFGSESDEELKPTKAELAQPAPIDDFEIADKRNSKSFQGTSRDVLPKPEPALAPEVDDVAVSEKGFGVIANAKIAPELALEIARDAKDLDEFQTASISRRQSFTETIQDQLDDLAVRLDVSGKVLDSERVEDHSAEDDQALAVSGEKQPRKTARPLWATLLLSLKVLAGLPVRCLKQTGSLQEQARPKWEPVLAAIPALLMASFAYSTVIYYKTSDLLRERNLFGRISEQRLANEDWAGAELAIRRACLTSNAPSNLWKYAQVLLRSPKPEERYKGYALVNLLASPEYDNLADAHIYLAREFLKKRELKVEQVPKYLSLIQNHLRTALATDPNRLDALEMLLDLLMTIEDEAEVERLVAPRVGQWPVGYYYLARISFSRGDRINQQIQAGFSVKYYESVPKLLQESLKDRERYLVSLALAGQWEKAEPIINDWLSTLEGPESISNWKNRFLAIRMMEKLSLPPEEVKNDTAVLLAELAKNPKNRDLWHVFSRFVDRKSSEQMKMFGTAMKLLGQYPDALDSDDYMLWGNIARKWGKNAEARKLLEKSLSLNSRNVIAANNLANILYKEPPKDYNRALELMEGVLAIEPGNPIYLETRGQILALVGQDERAIEDLTKSLNTFPDVPEIHETLGKLLRRNGRTELAMSHERRLKQLKELPPGRIQSGQIIPKTK